MPDPVRLTMSIQDPAGAGSGLPDGPTETAGLVLEPGQIVEGRVTVEVLEDVEFREAQVRFVWHTEGKGNRVTGEGATETLARGGKWLAGTSHGFSFRIQAPGGPLTYIGKILNVLWTLETRLDRSLLKSDVVESIPVHLQGTPDPDFASLGPVPQERDKLEAVKKGRVGTWVAVGVLFIILGIFYGAAHGWNLQTAGRWITILLIGGGLFIVFKGFWGRLGRGKLGAALFRTSGSTGRRPTSSSYSITPRL